MKVWVPVPLQAVPRLPHPADDENGLRVKQLIDSIRNPTAQAMVPQYTYVVRRTSGHSAQPSLCAISATL